MKKKKNRNLKELRATESAYDILLEDTAEKIDAMAARANGESIADIKKRGEEFGKKTGGSFSLEDYTVALFKKESDAKAALKLLDGVYAEAEQIAADIAKAPKAPALGQLPLRAAQMIQTGIDAASDLRDRVSNVKLGPLGDKYETIAFDFDGEPYSGLLKGRNKDLVVMGDGRESDKGIAARVLPIKMPSKQTSQQPPQPKPTAIPDAADITGKERIDALKDVKKGDITPEDQAVIQRKMESLSLM